MILSLFYGLRMPWIEARGQGVRPRKVTKVTPKHVFRGSEHRGRQDGGIGHQRRSGSGAKRVARCRRGGGV